MYIFRLPNWPKIGIILGLGFSSSFGPHPHLPPPPVKFFRESRSWGMWSVIKIKEFRAEQLLLKIKFLQTRWSRKKLIEQRKNVPLLITFLLLLVCHQITNGSVGNQFGTRYDGANTSVSLFKRNKEMYISTAANHCYANFHRTPIELRWGMIL